MNPIEKPDFLPFTSLPIPIEQSMEAGKYIISLEVAEGPLSSSQVFEILTGVIPTDFRTSRERSIGRQVFQKIGKMPNFRENDPARVLQVLERA